MSIPINKPYLTSLKEYRFRRYFTQILAWIRDHMDFVVKWIQPIVNKLALHHIDVKVGD